MIVRSLWDIGKAILTSVPIYHKYSHVPLDRRSRSVDVHQPVSGPKVEKEDHSPVVGATSLGIWIRSSRLQRAQSPNLQQVNVDGFLLSPHMNLPAGAHCLTALPKPFAHSRLILPYSHPGLCRPETHPFRAHYPRDVLAGTILGSAWGLLGMLIDGYLMNRIG